MPHARNPNFVGREDMLAELHRILTSGEAAAVTQAITGLGGIGKTQLATEYAYRYASNYALVWWMRAEEPATLAADYAALATTLELVSPEMSDQAALVTMVGQWLRQHRDWLLVFDNARAPAEVRSYIPLGGAGHALVTSRQPAWGGVARVVSVPVLPRLVATTFLVKRTGQADEAAAGELAQALGELPLALEQAGAYMETTGRSLGQYRVCDSSGTISVAKRRGGESYALR